MCWGYVSESTVERKIETGRGGENNELLCGRKITDRHLFTVDEGS